MKFLKNEWKKTLKDKKLMLSLIALLFIPFIYSGTFIWSFFDPTSNLENLPVAIVNEDNGAIFEDKKLTIGHDLVKELTRSNDFKWDVVDRKEALEGLDKNEYYMVLELPTDFSKNATTILEESPRKMQMIYMPNQSYNFISSSITDRAVAEIKANLTKEITRTYSEIMFNKVQEVSDGLAKASDGAVDLTEGMDEGYKGIKELKKGTIELKEGVYQLHLGSEDLLYAMNLLNKGTNEFEDGFDEFKSELENLEKGTTKLNDGVKEINGEISEYKQGMIQINNTIEQMIMADPSLNDDSRFMTLAQTTKTLTGKISLIEDGLNSVANGSSELEYGTKKLTKGSRDLNYAVSNLKEGQTKVTSGMKELDFGINSSYQGSKALVKGSDALLEGMMDLKDGGHELATNLKQGSEKTSESTGSDESKEMFSNPIFVNKQTESKVPNYGTGFTPYFLSLSLFMGALVMSFLLPLRERIGMPKSGTEWFLSKVSMVATIGAIQGTIASSAIMLFIGVEVQYPIYFVLFSIVTSITFLIFVQFLATALENPGRFIAVILFVLQLTTNGGTYPIELVEKTIRPLHNVLPMTYTVDAYRAIISSGKLELVVQALAVLVAYLVVSLLLNFLYFNVKFGKIDKNERKLAVVDVGENDELEEELEEETNVQIYSIDEELDEHEIENINEDEEVGNIEEQNENKNVNEEEVEEEEYEYRFVQEDERVKGNIDEEKEIIETEKEDLPKENNKLSKEDEELNKQLEEYLKAEEIKKKQDVQNTDEKELNEKNSSQEEEVDYLYKEEDNIEIEEEPKKELIKDEENEEEFESQLEKLMEKKEKEKEEKKKNYIYKEEDNSMTDSKEFNDQLNELLDKQEEPSNKKDDNLGDLFE